MQRLRDRVPELREAIAIHARGMIARDTAAGERFVTAAALESYRTATQAAAQCGPFDNYTAPALARLGSHYISKVRLVGPRGSALIQIRWKREADGNWRIAEAEYFPPGRSPWTGVGRPKPPGVVGRANA